MKDVREDSQNQVRGQPEDAQDQPKPGSRQERRTQNDETERFIASSSGEAARGGNMR